MTSRATIILASVLTLGLGSAAVAQTYMDDGYSPRGRDAERTRSERLDSVPAYPPSFRSDRDAEYGAGRNDGWSAKIQDDRQNSTNGVNTE
jgi:hypothetical protein